MKATCLVLALASLALYHPRPARACGPPPCWPAAFVPGDQGEVPANVPGLFWRPMSGPGASTDPANVVLKTAAAPTTPIALVAKPLGSGDILLVPAAPLAEGSYTIADRNACSLTGERGPEVAFTVGPAAPMPSDLGVLIAAKARVLELALETRAGSCSAPATVAETSFELVPSTSSAAWLDALHFETVVDGHPWSYQPALNVRIPPGASPTGRGRDRVFAICASDDKSLTGLTPGAHSVTMRATLPGAKDVLVSSTLNVTLQCAAAPSAPQPVDPPDDIASAPPEPGGCSAGGEGAGSIALALAALLALRPRRRRFPVLLRRLRQPGTRLARSALGA